MKVHQSHYMYQYNVNYVIVVPAGGQTGLGSDLGKAVWMIRISEQYTPQFGIVEDEYYKDSEGYVDKFYDSILFRLMAYRAPDMDGNAAQQPPFLNDNSQLAPKLRENEVTQLEFFTEVFRSQGITQRTSPGQYPFIRIYKVNYPADIDLRVNEFNLNIELIEIRLAAEAAAEDEENN